MIRKIPLVPTLLVGLAVLTMIGLGVWQLRRAGEKDALIARYQSAEALAPTAFPTTPISNDALPLFRRATGYCLRVTGTRRTAGTNRQGETGYVHIAECSTGAEGPGMAVQMGWSKDPNAKIAWSGGPVSGIIAPDSKMRMRLVSEQGLGGLQATARPSLQSIPNNHRSYAVQWFLFALIALLIYAIALRQRLKRHAPEPEPEPKP
jgi:cytochrome oxidase assembly protein ShyY1